VELAAPPAKGTDSLAAWLHAQRAAGLDDDRLRRRMERAVESAIDLPQDALALVEAAQDLDFPLHLYRAQERWLVRAGESAPDERMRRLGEALGFARQFVDEIAGSGQGDPRNG